MNKKMIELGSVPVIEDLMHLLLVEDDIKTARFIQSELEKHNHTVELVHDGRTGAALARERHYDLLIVDRMLPDIDGASMIKELRLDKVNTPTIVLSAMDGINHRVDGLEAGADDYLVKPFAFEELYARICALARRPPAQESITTFQVRGLELDLISRKVSYKGKELDLQSTEYRLLEYLMRRKGQVVTRAMLLEGVWDFNFDPKTSIVETHISRLRAKIEMICPETIISTVRGAGYCVNDS